jgi:hypothetical protein
MRRVVLALFCMAALAVSGAAASTAGSRPTVPQIKVETYAAVRASRASVVTLRVVGPNLRFAVRIHAADPAAYLKHRVHRVVDVVNTLTNRQWLFRSRTFAVVDRSDRVVFSVTMTRSGSSETTRWYVPPALADCARDIAFNVDIDPDNAAPACPA